MKGVGHSDGTLRISFAGASSEADGANIGQGLMYATQVPAIRSTRRVPTRGPFK